MRLPRMLVVLAIFSSPSFAQMTHEETIVRSAYARLKFAIEQAPVSQLAMEGVGAPVPSEFASLSSEQRISSSQIGIRLSDFVIGNAQDILGRKAGDLISSAIGQRLDIQSGGYSIVSKGRASSGWYVPRVSWQAADTTPPELAERSLRDFLASQWGAVLQPDKTWQTTHHTRSRSVTRERLSVHTGRYSCSATTARVMRSSSQRTARLRRPRLPMLCTSICSPTLL